MDRPLFKVINDQTLLAIAAELPQTLDDLGRLPGMSPVQIRRHGQQLLRAVGRGLSAAPLYPPRSPRPDERYLERLEALRTWRKVKAQQMGVTSDVSPAAGSDVLPGRECPAHTDGAGAGAGQIRPGGWSILATRSWLCCWQAKTPRHFHLEVIYENHFSRGGPDGDRFAASAGGEWVQDPAGMRPVPGQAQGSRCKRNRNFPFDPAKLDAVILSHAHIDHSGNLPNLVKSGFDGPIYATPATGHLANIMLLDSAHIQETDAEYVNDKNAKKGLPPVEPLYTIADAAQVAQTFLPDRLPPDL